jgi:hypothetical protein
VQVPAAYTRPVRRWRRWLLVPALVIVAAVAWRERGYVPMLSGPSAQAEAAAVQQLGVMFPGRQVSVLGSADYGGCALVDVAGLPEVNAVIMIEKQGRWVYAARSDGDNYFDGDDVPDRLDCQQVAEAGDSASTVPPSGP